MKQDRRGYPEIFRTELKPFILARAKGRCEGSSKNPGCRAKEGERHPATHDIVFLTVVHLNGDYGNRDVAMNKLCALCQECHSAVISPRSRIAKYKRLRMVKANQPDLPMDMGRGSRRMEG